MKRLLSVFALLALLCLAGCFEGTSEGTKAATTPKTEAAHVHQFTERVQDDAYLAEQPVCGQQRIYYYSCACGECGTLVFAGDVEPKEVQGKAEAEYYKSLSSQAEIIELLRTLDIESTRAGKWNGVEVSTYLPLTANGVLVNL